MRFVTTADKYFCPHMGPIVVTSKSKSTSGGAPIVTIEDLKNAKILCTATNKCTNVIVTQNGLSSTISGQQPVLDTATVRTNIGEARLQCGLGTGPVKIRAWSGPLDYDE